MFVSTILGEKGHEIYSIALGASVYKALELMENNNIGALLVFDQQQLVGIISERDYAREIILKGRSSKDTPVSEVMTRELVCVTPDKSVQICMSLMTTKHIRHLPVMESGKVVGIISIGDVVKSIISEQKHTIEDLEHYISGTY